MDSPICPGLHHSLLPPWDWSQAAVFIYHTVFKKKNKTKLILLFIGMKCSSITIKQWPPIFLAPGLGFMEDNSSTDQERGQDFRMIQVRYTDSELYLLLFHQLHFRSSGTRSQRLETPAINYISTQTRNSKFQNTREKIVLCTIKNIPKCLMLFKNWPLQGRQ